MAGNRRSVRLDTVAGEPVRFAQEREVLLRPTCLVRRPDEITGMLTIAYNNPTIS